MANKFKIGDKVTLGYKPWFKDRGTGVVIALDIHDGDLIAVAHDHWEGGHNGNGQLEGIAEWRQDIWFYTDSDLELISTTNRRWIITGEFDGKFSPSSAPREYKTRAQAEHVAQDMAKRHSVPFYVLETVYVAKAVAKTVISVEGTTL